MIEEMSDRQATILAGLAEFHGTDTWWRMPLFPHYTYTDGARFVAIECGAYWLIDAIFSCQLIRRVKREEFQVWSLKVKDRSALLTCDNGNGNIVYRQEIEYSDFPLDEMILYFENLCLCLPSER